MCQTQLNKFDFGATLAQHLIQMAHRVSSLRACLHGGGGPHVGEVTRFCG